ncbi:hypothetical protein BB560_002593 [Smittium megazygosporum]|uniref:Uncharacterized protein n=1 Tax=Smittium megazygosporum TaxID=133381 RepID=A0A2T9ZEC2_9FUNG|nr:hypothetical protein BB560_002593 [Smittium megazygosporum]
MGEGGWSYEIPNRVSLSTAKEARIFSKTSPPLPKQYRLVYQDVAPPPKASLQTKGYLIYAKKTHASKKITFHFASRKSLEINYNTCSTKVTKAKRKIKDDLLGFFSAVTK